MDHVTLLYLQISVAARNDERKADVTGRPPDGMNGRRETDLGLRLQYRRTDPQ